MPRPRHRAILARTLLATIALFVLRGLIALGFLQDLSKENRALLVTTSSVGIIDCYVGLMFLSVIRKRLRKRIWLRAMSAWNESSQARNAPNFSKVNYLSEVGLKHPAVRIYSRMGYRIANGENKEGYLQLINRDRRIELIACKQQPDLMKLHHVNSLQLEMKRTKAVCGFFGAPAGFTSEAVNRAVHR